MLPSITTRWKYAFFGIFLFFTAFSFLYPPFNSDSVRYSLPGNPFALQWLDYIGQSADGGSFHQGRYFTHVLIRILLQAGEPWLNIAHGLLITFILACVAASLKPGFYRSDDADFSHAFALTGVLLLMGMPDGMLLFYYITNHLVGNFIYVALVLCFLLPYRRLLQGDQAAPSPALFLPLAFLAGSSHEQSVAVFVLLLGLYGYLRIKKMPVPSWYGWGLGVFALGLIFVLLAAGSPKRLAEYGNTASWDFMGQQLNWQALGWKRYFYSFVRHFFLGANNLMPMALLLGPYSMAAVFLWYRHRQDAILFYLAAAWLMAGVMCASPFISGGPFDNAVYFLYVALGIGVYFNIKEIASIRYIIWALCVVFLCVAGIQALALYKPAQRYREITRLFKDASLGGEVNPTVPDYLPGALRTPFFNIHIANFHLHSFLLNRYGFESITVTNEKGESYKIAP